MVSIGKDEAKIKRIVDYLRAGASDKKMISIAFEYEDSNQRAGLSTFISINYMNEADAIRKYHFACVLYPLLAFMAESAGKLRNKVRSSIESDEENGGYYKNSINRSYSFCDYVEEIYEDLQSKNPENAENIAFDERILQKVYKKVRLNQSVEIILSDILPLGVSQGLASLVKGLFYSEKSLCRLRKEFSNVRNIKDVIDAEKAIKKDGYTALIYGRVGKSKSCSDFIKMILEEAESNLSKREQKYINSLKKACKLIH